MNATNATTNATANATTRAAAASGAAPAGGFWSPKRMAWAGGLLVAGLAIHGGYDMVRGYRSTLAEARQSLESQSRVIAEQTARSLQAIDTVLRHLGEQHSRGLVERLEPRAMHAYLAEQTVGLVQVDGLALFDVHGRTIASSIEAPSEVGDLDAGKLPAFERLRDDPYAGLAIGPAYRSSDTGRLIFPIGRRIENPDGDFIGVAGAGGRVDYFQRFYRDAYPEAGIRIALLHRDTTLLARHPPAEAALGRKVPLLRELLVAAEAGAIVQRQTSPLDGIERLGATRPVPGYPLAVVVTRDADNILAGWRSQAFGTALRTLGLGALALTLMVTVMRQFRRLTAARSSLESSEERFAAAVAGSDDGIWMLDYVRDVAFASVRSQQIIGLVPGPEILPLQENMARMQQQLHPEDLPRREEALRRHLAGETPAYVGEFRVRHPDGSYRWIRTHAKCFRDAEGRPIRLAGSTSDIDARKRAEEELRRSEERYALAMAGSRGGHWVWDTATDALFASERLNELFGVSTDPTGATRTEFFGSIRLHPDDRERIATIEADLRAGRIERSDCEFRILLPDGSERWILTRAQRFQNEQSVKIAGVSVDIGERKRAEAERQRLEEQLRQAQKLEAIGTLAGGIAHDFNNILSAILGYGELAQKGAVEGTEHWHHIQAAIAAGQRAKSLVERILAFSRSGMGERMPVHVQSVVDEALNAVAAGAPPGIELSRRLDAGDTGVLGDPTQVHQVVLNLCANAVQAMRAEGRMVVELDRTRLEAPLAVATCTLLPGDYLRLVVADSGSGIAPDVLARIFDPFFTTKEVGVGTGLGLSLVHGIVTDLGGGIAIESREGCGSRFTVYLPACAEPAVPLRTAPGEIVLGTGQTVLFVDDEEPLVRLGEETLAKLGYEPVGYTSASAALAALTSDIGRFDALLSDETMPGLTGSELARAARALAPDLPIVLMSGYVTPALVERATELGVIDVLGKPLASHDIARALSQALAHRSVPPEGLPKPGFANMLAATDVAAPLP